MDVKYTPSQLLRIRNRKQRLGIRTVSISMPDELFLELDARTENQERSGYVCRVLRQHFAKINEDDPRYRLTQKQREVAEYRHVAERLIHEKEKERALLEQQINATIQQLEDECAALEVEAQDKMRELVEEAGSG